jgi:hypothetical protein
MRYFNVNTALKYLIFYKIKKPKNSCPSCSRKISFFPLKKDGGAYVLHDTPQNGKTRLESGDIAFLKFFLHGVPNPFSMSWKQLSRT